MATKILVESPKLPIPDMRFNHIFSKSLQREMKMQQANKVTYYILGKVIIRDIIIMPFLQNMLWTGIFMTLKDPLRAYIRNVKNLLIAPRKNATI